VRMAAEPCPCGSVLRCVQRVVGRREDRAVLNGGGVLTVADLDEAVYGVEGVLGFTARLERGPSGDRLTAQVDAGGQAPASLFAEVGCRVEGLPALRGAGLEIAVEAWEGWDDLSPAAKQRITDLRKVE
jgi:phenylacetate-CoA ligase